MCTWLLHSNTLLLHQLIYPLLSLLLQDHRAPSVGLFLLGLSAGLCALPLSNPVLICLQTDLEWAGEILAPPLVSFGFLWLSQDHATAHVLLIGSGLLPLLCDWLSPDGLMVMTRCLALSSLSCSLTVCLFAGNATGALGSVALSLPSLVAPRVVLHSLTPLISQGALEGLLKWLLKGSMAVGCIASKRALGVYLEDLKNWDWCYSLTKDIPWLTQRYTDRIDCK